MHLGETLGIVQAACRYCTAISTQSGHDLCCTQKYTQVIKMSQDTQQKHIEVTQTADRLQSWLYS